VLEYLPEATITLLDTHDLIHNRILSFEKYKVHYNGIILDKAEEFNIFKCFDYIILIQKADYDYISKEIHDVQLILAPHAVALKKKLPAKQIKSVGYVASQYEPNVEALNWFLHYVWNKVNKEFGFILNVYGNISNAFSTIKRPDIIFHGVIENLDEIYNNIDIAVNPVRCGAGLKIKNVEALGYGIPLITTSHGASGIENGAKTAFLLADTAEEYLSAFEHLSNNYIDREQLSISAFEYAFSNFTEKKCYQGILDILNKS
jgi:glycosyltransferase involved in cell wall biosynthesis